MESDVETTTNQRVLQSYAELKSRLRVRSKSEFARIAGFVNTHWSEYETEKRRFTHKHLLALVNHFKGLSLSYLESGEGEILASLTAPSDAHAYALLSDIPVIHLTRVSFKARASFVELGGATTDSDLFGHVLHRLPPGKTEADYADAIVFDIEGDSMEPSLKSGNQVIAWPVPESRWEYLHNATCVVSYDDTVTVKRITDNDLFNNNRLVLRATGGSGGSFAVAREHIHSIWEVKEFYGTLPYTYYM